MDTLGELPPRFGKRWGGCVLPAGILEPGTYTLGLEYFSADRGGLDGVILELPDENQPKAKSRSIIHDRLGQEIQKNSRSFT